MGYLGNLFSKNSNIGYGCLVLLGSASTAGIVDLEIHQQILSTWGGSITDWFERVGHSISSSSSPASGQPVTFSDISAPFVTAWGYISTPVSSAWPYLQTGFEQIRTSYQEIFKALKDFLSSLIEPNIFNNIFKDLHLKIWRVLSFAVGGGSDRDNFVSLFQQGKKEVTETAAKFLLGMEQQGSKYFKADKGVFSFLLLKWMMNPKKVTEKFDRLSKTIKKLIDHSAKQQNGGSSSSDSSQEQKYVYTLTPDTVQQYLDVEEGIPEMLFNLMWMGEVTSKINTGYDVTAESKSLISWFFKSP